MKGRTAFVTGASRGIGSSIARTLADHGVNVVIGYLNSRDAAETLVEKILSDGGSAVARRIDVSERSSIRKAFGSTGVIDILVNNAALAQEKPFLDISDEDWDRMLAANLRGPFACIQEVLPGMMDRRWGRVVNIVSIGGQWGGVNQIHYASAKAGLIGLTRSVSKTFSGFGITCNAVSPGLVETDMTKNELSSPQGQEKIRTIPAGRIGFAAEVAAAVVFLVMPGSDYITGQTINVNGGMYFG
ncbi:MAG: 3-oxoacyl-ACP reductase FabG [Chlorobiaceae bacterium]|nr:3-oxoacyl-ACP reductase FabG [Chlorobiaceae bacterium]